MNDSTSKLVENCLAKTEIHQQWKQDYRTYENEKFFEQAFDYITHVLNAPKDSTYLDAGCGTGAHSARLAKRGFLVQAVDFSANVLKIVEDNVKAKGLDTRIKIQRADLLALPFKDKSIPYILCWGVLMHIPDLEKAISELTRVLKPGGIIVISEGNMFSLESIIQRRLRRFLGQEKADVRKTPAGLEYWCLTSDTTLLTRQANVQRLIEKFKQNQCTLEKRVAGQFTEVYTRVSSPLLKTIIHSFNNFWFRHIKIPHLAFGNIIIFQKKNGD